MAPFILGKCENSEHKKKKKTSSTQLLLRAKSELRVCLMNFGSVYDSSV